MKQIKNKPGYTSQICHEFTRGNVKSSKSSTLGEYMSDVRNNDLRDYTAQISTDNHSRVIPNSKKISTANFLSALKDLDGCQDVDAEDVEHSLAVYKDLQQETLSGEDIVGAVTDGVQDDDDGDDVIENTMSLMSHTEGMKALEAALCNVEQQSSAFPIDVMLIKKNGETMRQVAELLGFNKKRLLVFLM
ncbi:hypothetical protein AVEN_81948-1, partial [Araneus ventricosus]